MNKIPFKRARPLSQIQGARESLRLGWALSRIDITRVHVLRLGVQGTLGDSDLQNRRRVKTSSGSPLFFHPELNELNDLNDFNVTQDSEINPDSLPNQGSASERYLDQSPDRWPGQQLERHLAHHLDQHLVQQTDQRPDQDLASVSNFIDVRLVKPNRKYSRQKRLILKKVSSAAARSIASPTVMK